MVLKGAGTVILNENNEILLIKRHGTSTFNQMWANPGGKTEPGETQEEAAIRETKEELNIDVESIKPLGTYEDIKDGQLIGEYSGFLVKIIRGELKILDSKIAEIKYFKLHELPSNLAPYTKLYIKNL